MDFNQISYRKMATKDIFESLGWSYYPFGMIGFPTKELNEKFNKIVIKFSREFSSADVTLKKHGGPIYPSSEFCDELDILIGEYLAWLKTTYSDEIKHGFPRMRRLGMHTEVDPFMPQACYLAYGKCICTCGCDKIENACSNFDDWFRERYIWKFSMGNGYESTRFAEQVRKISAVCGAFQRCEHVIRPKFLAKTKELEKAKRIAEEKATEEEKCRCDALVRAERSNKIKEEYVSRLIATLEMRCNSDGKLSPCFDPVIQHEIEKSTGRMFIEIMAEAMKRTKDTSAKLQEAHRLEKLRGCPGAGVGAGACKLKTSGCICCCD